MRVRDDFDGRKSDGEDWHQSQEEGEWLVQHVARSGRSRFKAELNIRWKDDELTESRKCFTTDAVTEHC